MPQLSINWFQLLSLTGLSGCVGAAVSKWLEVRFFARYTEKQEHRRWLREARLKAFTNLTAEVQSMGLADGGMVDNPFAFRALASSAMLLIDDENLIMRIETYIQDRDKHFTRMKATKNHETVDQHKATSAEHKRLFVEADGIVADLKALLLKA